MARFGSRLNGLGIFLRGCAEHKERRFDLIFFQQLEYIPDAAAGAVLQRSADHIIGPLSGEQRRSFAGLVLESQHDGKSNSRGPADSIPV